MKLNYKTTLRAHNTIHSICKPPFAHTTLPFTHRDFSSHKKPTIWAMSSIVAARAPDGVESTQDCKRSLAGLSCHLFIGKLISTIHTHSGTGISHLCVNRARVDGIDSYVMLLCNFKRKGPGNRLKSGLGGCIRMTFSPSWKTS